MLERGEQGPNMVARMFSDLFGFLKLLYHFHEALLFIEWSYRHF